MPSAAPPVFHLRDPARPPRPLDSSTLGSTCASCASDLAAPNPPASASRFPDALANPRKNSSYVSPRVPAHDRAHRRILSSKRRRVEAHPPALSAVPRSANNASTQANTARCVLMLIKRRVREIVEWSGVCSSSPSSKKPPQRQRIRHPPRRSHAHYRSLRNTPLVAPESKSQAEARVVPVAQDRSEHIIPPQTRRTWHPPITRSTAYRKDVPAPPPTPCARSRCLLASPRHSVCSSPCAHSTNDPC